jgi:hypothetical protein
VAIGGIGVAIPELRREAEAAGEIEDDVGIGARFAGGRYDRRPELDVRLRLLADLEAEFQSLALEGRGDRQDHIGQLGGGVHEQVQMRIEVERLERLAAVTAVGMGQEHVRAEADHGANGVGRSLQDGAVEIGGTDPAPACRTQGTLGDAQCRRHPSGRG